MTVTTVDQGVDDVELDIVSVLQAAREFDVIDDQAKALEKRKKELKTRLTGLIELEGEPDDKGNLLLPLPEVCGRIKTLQLQRRVSNVLDEEAAESVLGSIEVDDETLWDRCIKMVPMLDESLIMAAHYQDLLSAEQIDEIFPEVETFAFVPIRVGKK